MIDLKEIYKKVLEEDALLNCCDTGDASTGEIASMDSQLPDNEIVQQSEMSTEILGKKCKHQSDGYLSIPNCFHIPKNILKLKRRKIK